MFNRTNQTAESKELSKFQSKKTTIVSEGFRITKNGNVIFFNGKTKLENLKLYYSHSFYVDNKKLRDTIMFTKHNKKVIPAVIKNNNIIGVQFHPELSGDSGAEIFKELMRG